MPKQIKALIIVAVFVLSGCKTVNVNVYSLPESGSVEVNVQVKGSDVESDAGYNP